MRQRATNKLDATDAAARAARRLTDPQPTVREYAALPKGGRGFCFAPSCRGSDGNTKESRAKK